MLRSGSVVLGSSLYRSIRQRVAWPRRRSIRAARAYRAARTPIARPALFTTPQPYQNNQITPSNLFCLKLLAAERKRTANGAGNKLALKMNELDLIKEVEKKPILYDKTVSGFNKTKLRDDAWKEIQESLNVSETECKKRWRSLRDSFIKLQRTHGGRTRWPYHQAMRFLLPHLEPSLTNSGSSKKDDDTDTEEETRRPQSSLPDLSFPERYDYEDEPAPKKTRLNSTEADPEAVRTDPDELFLLSCAPILKRLSAKQNVVARLKIQQVLYEAEFGTAMEIPYVTPASECGFENIDGGIE